MNRFTLFLLLIALAPTTRADLEQGRTLLPEAPAAALGFDPERLKRIDERIDRAIAEGQIPGAVVIVGRRGAIVHVRAAGRRGVEPKAEPMTRDTIFDMASLTKPVATATAVMILVEEGKLRLDDRVVTFLPELDNHGKDRITVEHLLRHRAGLVPDNPLKDYARRTRGGLEAGSPRSTSSRLRGTVRLLGRRVPDPGQARRADLGPAPGPVRRRNGSSGLLGHGGRPFPPARHAGPARSGRRPIGSLPPSGARRAARCSEGSSTIRGRGPWAGVAGHAGLFATADDLALFAADAPGRRSATADGRRLLAPLTVRAMFDPGTTPAGERRGLGWDVATRYSSPRGATCSVRRAWATPGSPGPACGSTPRPRRSSSS